MNSKRQMVSNLTATEISMTTVEYAAMRVLIDHVDEAKGMRAWPSLPRISSIMRACRNTTRRAINNLIASGLIVRESASNVQGIRKRTGHVFNLTPLLEGIGCPDHEGRGALDDPLSPEEGGIRCPPISDREGSPDDPLEAKGGSLDAPATRIARALDDPQGGIRCPSRGALDDPDKRIDKRIDKKEEEEETRLRSEEDRASKEASPCQATSPQDSNSDQPDTSSVDPESDREGQVDTRQEMERWIVAKLKNYWLATKDAHPSSEPLGVSCGAPVAKIAVMANVVTRSDARIFCLDVESRLEDYRLRGVEVRKAYGYLLDDLRKRYEAKIRGDEDEDTRRDPTSYEAQHAALEAAAEARRREAQELAESIEARRKQREKMLADDARRRERLCADDLPHFMSSIELEDKASWMRNAKPGAATNALWLDAIGEHIIRHIEDVHRVNADCAFVTGEMWEVMRRVAAMYTPALIDSEVVKLRGIDALDF